MSGNWKRTNTNLLGLTQEYLKTEIAQRAPDSLLATVWDEFYRVYDGLLRRYIGAHGLRNADADDCLQEVWLQVAQTLSEFEPPQDRSGLRAWLFTLVRSRANDLLRRRTRRTEQSIDAPGLDSQEPESKEFDPSESLDQEWEKAYLATVVEELRAQMSEPNYQLLYLRLIEGREVADVARALSITPEQVWYRQHRLMRKVRARVAIYSGQPFAAEPENSDL